MIEKVWAKFSFFDGYGLTKAAIAGEKTQRRVLVTYNRKKEQFKKPSYKIGDEIVLIQPYCDIPELQDKGLENTTGWKNKRYARVELMPYKVRITNIRTERLHDVTDEDALAEGVKTYRCEGLPDVYSFEGNNSLQMYKTPREAFIAMCDGLFDITTWRRNPDVYVYEFEVVPND